MVQLKDNRVNSSLDNNVKGFVSAKGKKIVNGEGKDILFRGVGFGSWFLPEGYMWCFPEMGDRPRRIEKMVRDLVGEKKASQFWDIYYSEYITEADIKIIADEGYNSVRVPINYRIFTENEDMFKYIDLLIEWCRKYSIYIILDLHGAPGGQTGTNIDDSEFNSPDLFINELNIQLTVDFWKMIAYRYKNEWIIAGYDLLNEPLPEWFSRYYKKVIPLYKKLIQAIREIDTKHMIILEGVHWATDWSIFNDKLDNNMMLQFHKYWNSPDRESLEAYLSKREELNVPIFMGEGGENNSDWYTGAFRLFEDLDISWNFWTWKKMDTTNSPFSITKPQEWNLFVNYLNGGEKPGREKSISILWKYLDNLSINKCVYNPEISRSILRRPPLSIPAIFYAFQDKGKGFNIISPKNSKPIGFRVNDKMKLSFTSGNRVEANFQHGGGERWKEDEWINIELNSGEWVNYDFLVNKQIENRQILITIKMKCNSGNGRVKLTLDNQEFRDYYSCSNLWTNIKGTRAFTPKKGLNRINLIVENGPVKIEKLKLEVL